MKKLLFVCIISLNTFLFSQQDCIEDVDLNNNSTPCCNTIISTGFPNPTNNDFPALLNQFDWLNGGSGLNTISVNTSGGISQINHPFLYEIPDYKWFSNYQSSFNFDIDTHNMNPRFGWELLHMNLGLGLHNIKFYNLNQ